MLDKGSSRRRRGPRLRAGVTVIPEAVRQARLEAGLSLAELAGGTVSRQMISHVETGRSRPSLALLQHIASRTGKPLTFFLPADQDNLPLPYWSERPRTLLRLQELAMREEWQEIARLAPLLLPNLAGHRWQAEARAVIGEAYCHLLKPREALNELRLAKVYADQTTDPWLTVDCADWQAVALCQLGDVSALSLAEEALHRARQLDPPIPDVEARILEHIGFIQVCRENWAGAIEAYRMAEAVGDNVRSLRRAALVYQNLKVAYESLGRLDLATKYGYKAIALAERRSDMRALGAAENNLAVLLMHRGDYEGAEEMLRKAGEHYAQAGAERFALSYLFHSYADLYLRWGRLDDAEHYLQQALAVARRLEETSQEGIILQTLGRLAARRERVEEAERHYEAAVSILGELDVPGALRSCQQEFGEWLLEHGQPERAARHLSAALNQPRTLSPPPWLVPPRFMVSGTTEA
jgi:tetratricopeptide (TPR) repeat protein